MHDSSDTSLLYSIPSLSPMDSATGAETDEDRNPKKKHMRRKQSISSITAVSVSNEDDG